MIIDCEDCELARTSACEDCVVTFLLDRQQGVVALDVDEARAVRNLQEGGLVPLSRYRRSGMARSGP